MSRQYEARVIFQRVAQEAKAQAERERKRRIEREIQLVEELTSQRTTLEAQLSKLQQERNQKLHDLDQEKAQQLARQLALNSQKDLSDLQERIDRLQVIIDDKREHQAKANATFEAVRKMNEQTYMVYNVLESTLVGWNEMHMEQLEIEGDEIVARFAQIAEEDQARAVKLSYKDDRAGALALDITEGFEGDECETLFHELQDEAAQRGLRLEETGRLSRPGRSDAPPPPVPPRLIH